MLVVAILFPNGKNKKLVIAISYQIAIKKRQNLHERMNNLYLLVC